MSADEQNQSQWGNYYRAVGDRPPRELFRLAVGRFGQAGQYDGFAVDLGCGAGIEAAELLRRGWRVLAIDSQPEAFAHLLSRVPPELRPRLETHLASFEQVTLPPADLIWAGLSLPFCPPEHFNRLWTEIVDSLRPGGRIAADFFGPLHAWADNERMTFHTAAQIRELCGPLYIEFFGEEEGERPTALQGIQHWHGFTLIAGKP